MQFQAFLPRFAPPGTHPGSSASRPSQRQPHLFVTVASENPSPGPAPSPIPPHPGPCRPSLAVQLHRPISPPWMVLDLCWLQIEPAPRADQNQRVCTIRIFACASTVAYGLRCAFQPVVFTSTGSVLVCQIRTTVYPSGCFGSHSSPRKCRAPVDAFPVGQDFGGGPGAGIFFPTDPRPAGSPGSRKNLKMSLVTLLRALRHLPWPTERILRHID